MPECDLCAQKLPRLTLWWFSKNSLKIQPCARKLFLIQPYWTIFISGIWGLDSGDIYFREVLFRRYVPWSLDYLVNNKLHQYVCLPLLVLMGLIFKKYLQNMQNVNHIMVRHLDINDIWDQCHFKGTHVPLKSWNPVFLISDKGYYKKKSMPKKYFFTLKLLGGQMALP